MLMKSCYTGIFLTIKKIHMSTFPHYAKSVMDAVYAMAHVDKSSQNSVFWNF